MISPPNLSDAAGTAFWQHAPHFAASLAQTAAMRGLTVTRLDGSTCPIPITGTPQVIETSQLQWRVQRAADLACATLKMATAAANTPLLADGLLGALSPLERQLALQGLNSLRRLATTRVDFFDGPPLRALEVNATIPAMQGYSDIAAAAFLDVVGGHAGAEPQTIARWKQANGSNAAALLAALEDGYTAERPNGRLQTIALLCRRNDAQLGELLFLRDHFREAGYRADVVHPDEFWAEGDSATFSGVGYELVYRHLFVRRLEESSAPECTALAAFFGQRRTQGTVVLNPPASQVEVKLVFALLSESTERDELAELAGLTAPERAAVAEHVPWTRQLKAGVVLDDVLADPDSFVLKRSWDYGGRAVLVGACREQRDFTDRVAAAWPGVSSTWDDICHAALSDSRGGGFIVQRRVESPLVPHRICHADRIEDVALHVDFSAYASVGLSQEPAWGGVCRGSVSSVVNIMGGGGLVPLIRADVADELAAMLRARGHGDPPPS